MKIPISDNIIKHYLQNVYFVNGHSYAGKSTMVKMLADRFIMIWYFAVKTISPACLIRSQKKCCRGGNSPLCVISTR